MKQLLLIILFSTAIFGQSGKSVLTQAQKDSIISLIGGVVIDASVSGYETLSDALTTISTDKKTLVIKDTQDLDVNIPANITLRFIDDGKINFTSADTIKARIEPIDKQIFTGTTPIIYYNDINPIWFGADRTGNENSGDAFQSAFNCLSFYGGVVNVPTGTYTIDKTVSTSKRGIVFQGNSAQTWDKQQGTPQLDINQGVKLFFTAQNDTMFNFYFATEGDRYPGPKITGLAFINAVSDTSGLYAIRINGKYNTLIQNCSFGGFMKGTAVYMDGGTPGQPASSESNITYSIIDCEFWNNYHSIDYKGHSNGGLIKGGRIATLRTEPLWAGSVGIHLEEKCVVRDVIFDMVDTAIVFGGANRLTSNRGSEFNFVDNIMVDGVGTVIVASENSRLNIVSNSVVSATDNDIVDRNEIAYGYNQYLNNIGNAGVSFTGSTKPIYIFSSVNSLTGRIPKTIFNNANRTGKAVGDSSGTANYVFGGSVWMDSTLFVDDNATFDNNIYTVGTTYSKRLSIDSSGYFGYGIYSKGSKSFTLKNPTDSENYFLFRTDKEITIDSVYAETKDSSKTFNLNYSSTRAGAGVDFFNSDTTLSSGEVTIVPEGINIPANYAIKLTTSDTLGSVDEELGITLYYKEEQNPNLITNGTCEGTYTDGKAVGWTVQNANTTPTEQTGITGSAQGWTCPLGFFSGTLRASGTTTEIGETYSITFYVKRISGSGTEVEATFYPANQTNTTTSFTVNGTDWTKCELEGTATIATAIYLLISSDASQGDTSVYAIDNVTSRKK